jgi:hypothetical protein
MYVSKLKRLKDLEIELSQDKQIVAELALHITAQKNVI